MQTCVRSSGKVRIVEEFAVLCSGHRLCGAHSIKVAAGDSILRPGDDGEHCGGYNAGDDTDDGLF